MVNFCLGMPSQTSISEVDGNFSAQRTIANLLIFIGWQMICLACHRKLPFPQQMVNDSSGVPSQTYFSLSDGK
jgi:hypothetical protein